MQKLQFLQCPLEGALKSEPVYGDYVYSQKLQKVTVSIFFFRLFNIKKTPHCTHKYTLMSI